MRGCQNCRVYRISSSLGLLFAACDDFTEDLTAGLSRLRAPDLRPRNPTDNAGSYCHLHLWRPTLRDRQLRASARQFLFRDRKLMTLAGLDH
jgi:hypothetical protein